MNLNLTLIASFPGFANLLTNYKLEGVARLEKDPGQNGIVLNQTYKKIILDLEYILHVSYSLCPVI